MNHGILRYGLSSICCAVLALGLSGCWQLTDSAQETVNISAQLVTGGSLKLTNANGFVKITGSSVEGLNIQADKKVQIYSSLFQDAGMDAATALSQVAINVTGSDTQAEVSTDAPTGNNARSIVTTVDYTISVPTQALLDITNTNGEVSIIGIDGSILLQVENGNLSCNDTTGVLEVELSNGDVSVFHKDPLTAAERIDCDVSNGDVELSILATSTFEIDAECTNGEIDDGNFGFQVSGYLSRVANDVVGAGGARIYVRIKNGDLSFDPVFVMQ